MFAQHGSKLSILFGFLFILSLAACNAQAVAPAPITPTSTAASVQNQPITLRLAVSDAQVAPSKPFVDEFVNQVKERSGGNLIIQPVLEAGEGTKAGFEQGVIAAVKSGDYDLGMAGSRAFDLEGVTSLRALQTPFLIDSDALAVAVARSSAAGQMLDGMTAQGLSGLTLWPEDLRHPFSVVKEKPLVSPADFVGADIRTTPSAVSYALIEALGGKPVFGTGDYQGAESGLSQGFSLTGNPIATGNVVFFPKFQVLFANRAALDRLSEAQRAILREAAAAIQEKAIAEHPSEAEAGAAWCAEAGSIVLTSDEQLAAFVKAAQPVIDQIETDSANAAIVAEIRELKTKTPPSPGAQACALQAAEPAPTQAAETQAWSEGMLPNGVWQAELTNDDVIQMGVSVANAPDWSGVYTITVQDGAFYWSWLGTEGEAAGQTASCEGTPVQVEDFVRITYTDNRDCKDVVDDLQWRLDDQGLLHLHLVATQNAPFTELKASYEARPFQKVADQ